MANDDKMKKSGGVFSTLKSSRKVTKEELKPHAERFRAKVLPAIKAQRKEKEAGAQRARTFKLLGGWTQTERRLDIGQKR